MTTDRVTDYLALDHARLHALLTAAQRSDGFDAAPFAEFRRGLLRHVAIEEKLLFAALRRAGQREALARAYELRVDHAALTSLLVPTPDRALCGELEGLLRAHDAKEEGPDGVYAACERALSPAESEALAQEARAFPEVRVAPHSDNPRAPRTASAALAAAQRLRRPNEEQSS